MQQPCCQSVIASFHEGKSEASPFEVMFFQGFLSLKSLLLQIVQLLPAAVDGSQWWCSVDLAVRYEEQLSRARQFLSASGRAKNGSSINDGRELTLLKNRAQCPHCGILFEGGNHNTEHIHPRALGGENTDSNRIQFCLACNNARNLVMQTILGHPSYFKNYPQNWPMVEEYLLWSEVSIDDGLSAGSQVDSIHQKFLMYRFSGHYSPTQIVNAYGRFSSWKKGDSPNYTFGNRQGVTRKQMVPQKTKT